MDINVNTEEEFEFFECLFQERKAFLEKKQIKDICNYSNWPDIIINPSINVTENSTNYECPF